MGAHDENSSYDQQLSAVTDELVDTSDGQNSETAAYFAMRHSGPLPPASEFQDYNNTLPGAADRILLLTENEAEHRRSLQKEHLNKYYESLAEDKKIMRRGQLFAFVLGIVFIVAGIVISYVGNPVMGTILPLGYTLVAMIGVFMTGKFKEHSTKSDDFLENDD